MTIQEQEKYMLIALGEAKIAASKGEVPVGALIVCGSEIISKAHNLVESDNNITAHAEILAITRAEKVLNNWRLNEAILFTTLEPCPMCCSAIILSRVKTVVFGTSDKRLGSCGSVFDLSQHPLMPSNPQIIGGVLEKECSSILSDFFSKIR